MTPSRKIYLDMVGCRLNQSELERLGAQVRQAGFEIVADPTLADAAIINTCAVTAKAASDSRQLTRRLNRSGIQDIILTGCWATLEPDQAASLPGVDRVVRNEQKDQLVHKVFGANGEEASPSFQPRRPLPGQRRRTRAFIKIQDGCDKHCTFCITTVARGRSRSTTLTSIIQDIKAATAGGVKEIVLTGVQLGAWGIDLSSDLNLEKLVREILRQTSVPRIRLSSIEPWSITSGLLDLWSDDRLCKQLHIPLQSGSAHVLRRMARNTSPRRYEQLVDQIRSKYPDMAITTDIIVGFPGEQEDDFEESLRYIEGINFAGGHVFTYSERAGTAAATYPHPIPNNIRQERSRRMRSILSECRIRFEDGYIGQHVEVLWERWTDEDPFAPTLSGNSTEGILMHASSSINAVNTIQTVHITGRDQQGHLIGKIA